MSEFVSQDWGEAVLSDLASLITKGTTPSSLGFEYQKSGISFIKVESIDVSGKFLKKKFAYISEAANKALARSVILENDVLFSIAGALGRTAIATKEILPANTNQALAIIRLRDGELIDKEYLYYYLNGPQITETIDRINVQSAQANLSLGDISSFEISYPIDLVEQQKIAKILSTVDNLIENTQTLIEKYTAIKQGMMADLFTRGIDMTTSDTPNSKGGKLRPSYDAAPELYKQTELGWVPKEWEILSFGELADYKNGNSFSADDWKEEGYPIIRIQNLNGSNEYNYYEGQVKEGWHILPGDLLFAWSGQKGVSFGARIWNGPEGVLNQHIFKVYENSKLLSRQFLYYLFKLNVGRIEDNAHGFKDSFVHVTRSELTDVTVMVPPKEEQAVIEQRVISLDRKLEQELGSLEKYKKLKKGLMQDLLTGKVRV